MQNLVHYALMLEAENYGLQPKILVGQKIWGEPKRFISGEQQYFVWDTAFQSTKWLNKSPAYLLSWYNHLHILGGHVLCPTLATPMLRLIVQCFQLGLMVRAFGAKTLLNICFDLGTVEIKSFSRRSDNKASLWTGFLLRYMFSNFTRFHSFFCLITTEKYFYLGHRNAFNLIHWKTWWFQHIGNTFKKSQFDDVSIFLGSLFHE